MTTFALPAIAPAALAAPDQDAITLNAVQTAGMLVRDLAEIQVHDDDSHARAASALVAAQNTWKQLEERRTAVKQPALDFGRQVDGYYKSAQDPLKAAAEQLKQRVLQYQQRIAREAEERRRAAEEAARKAEQDAARIKAEQEAAAKRAAESGQAAPAIDPFAAAEAEAEALAAAEVAAQPVPVQPRTQRVAGGGSVATREVVKWKVADLAQVPREFLIVDERKVAALVKAAGQDAPNTVKIPGIEVFVEQALAVRR